MEEFNASYSRMMYSSLPPGKRMIGSLAEALNTTHKYFQAMGAKVAPTTSYNFASNKEAKALLDNTMWEHIKAKIEVVADFRYL